MKYLKLFENFGRYDFGRYEKPQDLYAIERSINKEDISINDYIEIRSAIPNLGASRVEHRANGERYFFVNFDFDDGIRFASIYYLGDYCYGMCVYGMSDDENGGGDFELESVEIFDQIDSLLDALEKYNK